MTDKVKIAVLDDYQGVALKLADWSAVAPRATIDVFHDHLADPDELVARLAPYQVICVMRERTPLTAPLLARLPHLKLIASTGRRNASIDEAAAKERGIQVAHTGYFSSPTVELTWALILAGARHLVAENASLRSGGWQRYVGEDLSRKTLGIVGLGNLGSLVAKVGLAFGMQVIAWSQNLSAERCAEVGAKLASKEELLQQSDFITIHLVLSERTRHLIGAPEFLQMKPSAYLVNTSRGPIVSEPALIQALASSQIAGAAIDVYDQEPLPAGHPFRRIDNLLATPHIGYVTRAVYERFYGDTVTNILGWLDSRA